MREIDNSDIRAIIFELYCLLMRNIISLQAAKYFQFFSFLDEIFFFKRKLICQSKSWEMKIHLLKLLELSIDFTIN